MAAIESDSACPPARALAARLRGARWARGPERIVFGRLIAGMRQESATPDIQVARIAARQHGVVSQRQLLAAGLSASGISRRVAAGRLHRVHRGTYAVGHAAISREGTWMAAVLACGSGAPSEVRGSVLEQWGAALSHRSAAELWELLPPGNGLVHVSVPGTGGRRRGSLGLHRRKSLPSASVTSRRGIPVTTPARTIADLLRSVSPQLRRRAIRQAEVLGLPLDPETATDRTRSELERDFLRLCRRHRLPPPEVNSRVGPFLVDFLWPERRLIVETDGYRYHRGRQAFEDDRSRDLALRARGFEVVRLSGKQVSEGSEHLAQILRAAGARLPGSLVE